VAQAQSDEPVEPHSERPERTTKSSVGSRFRSPAVIAAIAALIGAIIGFGGSTLSAWLQAKSARDQARYSDLRQACATYSSALAAWTLDARVLMAPLMPKGNKDTWDKSRARAVATQLLRDAAAEQAAFSNVLLLSTSTKALDEAGYASDDIELAIGYLYPGEGAKTWGTVEDRIDTVRAANRDMVIACRAELGERNPR
jgi:hypothetical protein